MRGVGDPRGPPEHRPDPRLELAGLERLEHVVVGAGVERLHHALVVVPRGGHDDRHRRDRAQHPQQLAAVEVGQAQVEDDEVRTFLHRLLQPGQRGAGRADRVAALAQRADQRRADALVVLHDQELGHVATLTLPRARSGGTGVALTRPWGGLNPFGRMLPAMKRTLALGAAWTGSAVAAVGLGFLAVSLVGASASPGTVPVGLGRDVVLGGDGRPRPRPPRRRRPRRRRSR